MNIPLPEAHPWSFPSEHQWPETSKLFARHVDLKCMYTSDEAVHNASRQAVHPDILSFSV